jgi:hypothetical protein
MTIEPNILILPPLNAVHVAEEAATLDVLTGGNERHLHKEPRRELGFLFSLFHNQREAPSMPTLTTTEHGEIHVPHHQVTRMAERLWRLGSPTRQTAYVEKARRRLAAGPPRRSDAAIVLAAGNERRSPDDQSVSSAD